MRRLCMTAVSVFLVALSAEGAGAMMVKIPLEQLAREAELIVVGRVEGVKSEKRGSVLFSLAELKTEKAVKGKIPPTGSITVEFAGGKLGDQVFAMEDSPDYKQGEEVIAFIKKLPDSDTYTTIGLFQGKFLVEKGVVVRERLPLDKFLQRIEAALQ